MGNSIIIKGADFSANAVDKEPYVFSGDWFNATIGDGTLRIASQNAHGIITSLGIPMTSLRTAAGTVKIKVEGYESLSRGLKVAVCGASVSISQPGNKTYDSKLPSSGYEMLQLDGTYTFNASQISQSSYLYVGFVETESKTSDTRSDAEMPTNWMTTNNCVLCISD